MKEKLFDVFRSRGMRLIVFPLFTVMLFYCVCATIVVLDRDDVIDSYFGQLADSAAENEALQTQIEKIEAELTNTKEQERLTKETIATQKAEYEKQIEDWSLAYSDVRYYIMDNLSFGNIGSESPLLVDSRYDSAMIDMLLRHFEARYSGDVEAYKKTLASLQAANTDELLARVESEPVMAKVKVISSTIDDDSISDSFNETGGRYIPILVLTAATETEMEKPTEHIFHVGVTKVEGEWRVYDYD